jgi:hypothetical protein
MDRVSERVQEQMAAYRERKAARRAAEAARAERRAAGVAARRRAKLGLVSTSDNRQQADRPSSAST